MQIGYAILSRAHKHQLFPNVWLLCFFLIKKIVIITWKFLLATKYRILWITRMAFRWGSVSLWKTHLHQGWLSSTCYTCLHPFFHLIEWMCETMKKLADISLHTWTLISIGKNIKFHYYCSIYIKSLSSITCLPLNVMKVSYRKNKGG